MLNRPPSILSGVGANGVSFAITATLQVVSFPLLLASFGTEQLGNYLVLMAVPAYLALFDLGLGMATATALTQHYVHSRVRAFRETLAAAAGGILLLSLVVQVPLMLAVWLLDLKAIFGLDALSETEASVIAAALILWAAGSIATSFVEGLWRATGRFERGIITLAGLRLVDSGAYLSVAATTESPVFAASTLCAIKFLTLLVYLELLRRREPLIGLQMPTSWMKSIKDLAAPSLGSLAIPLSSAIQVQAVTILVGRLLGPESVVLLAAVRIVANLLRQLNFVILHGMQPQLTRVLALADTRRAQRLVLLGLRSVISVDLLVAAALTAGMGSIALQLLGVSGDSATLLSLMVLAVLFEAPLLAFLQPIIASNRHAPVAIAMATTAIASLVAVAVALPEFGLKAIPIAQVVQVLLLLPYVVRLSGRCLSKETGVKSSGL